MRLPSFKRIYTNDYPKDQQPLVDKLSFPINNGIETLNQMASHNVSIRDNIACTVTDGITVTVDANGIPTNNVTYPLSLTTTVDGIQVISAVGIDKNGNVVYPSAGVFVTGSPSQGKMIINHVAGLPANISFTLRLITYQN